MKKRLISFFLAVVLMVACLPRLSLPVRAATSGMCGETAYWEFDEATGRLTITGSGYIYDYIDREQLWGPFCEDIKTVSIVPVPLKSLTNIPYGAFTDCPKLTSVTIPNGVKNIGGEAFRNCRNLSRINLPDSLESIGQMAFYSCVSLSSLSIPDNVTTIEPNAFYGCIRLKSIVLPESLTEIAQFTFQYCADLTSVYIPDHLTKIGSNAFDSSGLKNITIPDSVTEIGTAAFWGCTELNSIKFPSGLKEISGASFLFCTGLESITIPGSVTAIRGSAFSECDRLTDVYYLGTKTEWDKIIIDEGNDPLRKAAMHYIDLSSDNQLDYYLSGCPGDGLATVYNNDLALIAANLCEKAGGSNNVSVCNYLTWDLGFEDENVRSNNYGDSLAFTIATRKYAFAGEDENTELMVIVARGSVTPYEFTGDAASLPSESIDAFCPGHYAYKIVYTFYNEIMREYYATIKPGVKYKILLTGHSLGGAAANLSAAYLMFAGNSDVYCYTFGAVNSIDSRQTISDGYENIHNIYNVVDTYSPKQYGDYLLTGMGTAVGKFGHLDLYCHEHRTVGDKMKMTSTQIMDAVNHQMYNYVEDVKNHTVEKVLGSCGHGCDYQFMTTLACPVDVDVYCEDELVGRVVNNEVDASVTTLDIEVVDEVKFIRYPDDRPYRLVIRAFDEGTMLYYTTGTSDAEGSKMISHVSLVAGKEFRSEVGGRIEIPDIRLIVTDDQGDAVAEVREDGAEVPVGNPFTDVRETDYFYDAVAWAVNQTPQITNGVDSAHFGPARGCTRAQVVTFLWRAAGCPEPGVSENPFADVQQDAYYYKAVLWAVERQITNGVSPTAFSPDATCTRGQIVTFLWRADGSSRTVTVKNPFADVSKTGFYYPAMLWAVENGVTKGTGETTFSPDATCTRGQVVTFLYRASQENRFSLFDEKSYEIVVSTASWSEALAAAKEKGGKLVSFDSRQEYLFVLELIQAQDLVDGVYFTLGGRRDDGSELYCWADAEDCLSGMPLNGETAWCSDCWEPGEPNLEWNGRKESVVMMYYDKTESRWAWYDGSPTERNPSRTYAYIIEYPL